MASSVNLSQLGSSVSDLAGKIDGGISLSDVSITQLGNSISSALMGALSSLLPRMMEYASGIFSHVSGVGTYSDASFIRSMSSGSPFGIANTAAALGTGMLDKQSYIIQYANSLGYNTTDYGKAEGFLKRTGQFDRANELVYAAGVKGRSGGLDPNAARADASFTAKMQLFNESIATARQEAGNGQFKDLFKGKDVSTLNYKDLQSAVQEENKRLDAIITSDSSSSADKAAAKKRQEDLNNSKLVGAIGDAEQFGNLNNSMGLTPENQARVAQLAGISMSQAIFDPGSVQSAYEKEVAGSFAEKSLQRTRGVAKDEFGDLFKGKDVDNMSASQIADVVNAEIDRVQKDKRLTDDERSQLTSYMRGSATLRNATDAMEFSGEKKMSKENAELVESTARSRLPFTPGEVDAIRRQELAGGFGMLMNEAALGVEGDAYTDPNKAVGAVQGFVQTVGGMDQARQIATNWAASDQFDKDVNLAFAGNEGRRDELIRQMGSDDSEKAEAARAELFKTVMDYTNEHGGDSTGLGRAAAMQQHAMAATGGNAAEAQNILNVLSAAYGVTSREGVTEELASGGGRVLEYLRKTAENGDVFVEKLGQVKQSLDELGIESTDINGNPNKLMAQLTAASLGVDLGMRNANVGDTAVAAAAANEFARDMAGSRESNELGSMMGYLTSRGDIDQEAIIQFGRDASKGQWDPEKMEEEMAKRFGQDKVNKMKALFDADRTGQVRKANAQRGIGMMMDDEETNRNLQHASYGGVFNDNLISLTEQDAFSGMFSGPRKKENLKNLMKNKDLWKQFTAAGYSEQMINDYLNNPDLVPEAQRRVLEKMEGFDPNNKENAKELQIMLKGMEDNAEMNYNVGGHTKSGESGNAAMVDYLNNQEKYAELDVDKGPNAITAAAAAAGANTDRIAGDQANIDAAQRASQEMQDLHTTLESKKNEADTIDEVIDKVERPKEEGGMGLEALGPAIEELASAMGKLSGLFEDYLKRPSTP